MLRIDGSYGEGGGQVLRTALALSAILGVPIEVTNIRAGRKNPGLQAQHLTAVNALTTITRAEVQGATLSSTHLRFSPGEVQAGEYRFDVGTAGAISLVLQAILLPLASAERLSRLALSGGTHVPWSPPYHYLTEALLPTLAMMGFKTELELVRWGFYPKGGGEVKGIVHPIHAIRAWNPGERGALMRIRGLSAVANLPVSIAKRQKDQVQIRLKEAGLDVQIDLLEAGAKGQGTFFFLLAEFEGTRAGFSALGERGKPAERVADEAVEAFLAFLKSGAAIDSYLADQLLLPMALAHETSTMTTSRISQHLLTNVWLIQQFLPIEMRVEGKPGGAGTVIVEGAHVLNRTLEPSPVER
ncbi:MAG: RNA 3'-phosphate cyclase [candidate division NC10 bacterium]|nr:RNA 3'-phosphate cyclase [candidate division NC10 bacterium]